MEREKDKLKFKPINKGLGFHPFSDGLPYTPQKKLLPQTKTSRTMGIGAVQAGPPRFAFPQTPHLPQTPQALTPARGTLLAADAPSKNPVIVDTPYGFLYLLKRVVAYVLDSTLNIGLCAGGLVYALYRMNLDLSQLAQVEILLASGLFLTLFNWALIAAQEIAFHTTVGKRLMGLRVSGPPATTFLRAFFFLISAAFCALGLIWGIFDRRRRCWHDVAADLQPEEIVDLS